MKRRMGWLVVSGLMVLSLVLASCAPKVTEEKKAVTEEKKAVTEEKKVVAEEKKVVAEKEAAPQYGGTLVVSQLDEPQYFDDVFGTPGVAHTRGKSNVIRFTAPVLEHAVTLDRLQGPGTGERQTWAGMFNWFPAPEQFTGNLAESWEIIQPDTIIYHVRKGVYFQDKRPVGAMPMTADDFVFSWVRNWGTPGSTRRINVAFLSDMVNVANSIYIHPNDPWAVVVKTLPGQIAFVWEYTAQQTGIVPRALEQIGGAPRTWKELVGTGPFILTDYVSGASTTWVRNPNYWGKDELYPQNQLPYLDTYKEVIIPDLATRMAALRTGKIDQLFPEIEWGDAKQLIKGNPELEYIEFNMAAGQAIYMRHDRKPYNDVRVRQAMMLAIDHQAIVQDYYEGRAVSFFYPAHPIPEHKNYFVPLEEMPEIVKQMWAYHPDKAKQLLTEAGFPNGFPTEILVNGSQEEDIDILSIVKEMWAKVGIDLKIAVRESAVFRSMTATAPFQYEHGVIQSTSAVTPQKWQRELKDLHTNYARLDNPLIEAAFKAQEAAYFDDAEKGRIVRGIAAKLQEQANIILLPQPYAYIFWQPWLKGYYGERQPEFHAAKRWVRYVWIDSVLKKSMGH